MSQLSGAVRKRAAGVPEARVGRQLGFQHPIAAGDCLTEGSSRWRTASGVALRRRRARMRPPAARPDRSRPAPRRALPLGEGPGLLSDFQQSFALPKQRFQAQEFATLSIGAHLVQLPHASLARHPFLSPIKKIGPSMRNCLSRALACACFVVLTKSIGRAFEAAGWEVVSLDIVSKFEPTILCDIRSWDYALFPLGHFDMVWASPVCTEYSRALTMRPRRLKEGDTLVLRPGC